jgi:hypothetical protein
MADEASKGLDFLKQKVGPLPLFVWLGAGIGIWWYLERQKSSSSASQAANQQTDPAGNVGSIDPATGYVYGTPEDEAALASQNSGSTGEGSGGTGSTSGGQTYADNNAWGIAAVNYLVGIGIDGTTANQAIELYLSSQALTSEQQGDVNLAIQSLGPPPSLPGPVSTNPPPVTTPGPPGTGGSPVSTSAPAPTGLTVTSKTVNSVAIKWNASKGATGYHIEVNDESTKKTAAAADTSSTDTSATLRGLTAGHSYTIGVWAKPPISVVLTAAHAGTSVTLPKATLVPAAK